MMQHFTPASAWSDYPHLTIDEFIRDFPDVAQRESKFYEDDDESFRDRYEGRSIILIKGDISVTQAQIKELAEGWRLLAVDGNLQVTESASNILYVSGDLYCHSVTLNNSDWLHYPVGGRIIASDCAWLCAEDHEIMQDAPHVQLETRFLFSWFYSLDNLKLSTDTTVFILGDWDYCSNLDLPNPVFPWHDSVYVLKDQFVYTVDCDSSDAMDWDCHAIDKALLRGEDLFREGFDIACMPYQRAADEALSMKDYRRAYQLYKQSASISPAYYEAWYGMACSLHDVGAYQHALKIYQEAMLRFPERQTGLVNYAANYGALCAIRCRELPLAIELATISINHTREGCYNRDRLAHAYRFRAEAYLLSGQDDDAFTDLERALDFNERHSTANWLMGLVYYRRNDLDRAQQYHQNACKRDPDFSIFYDQACNTDFLSGKPIEVDWDSEDCAISVMNVDYWREYIQSNAPTQLKRVPVEFRTTELCMQVLDAVGFKNTESIAKHIPTASFTREMAEGLIKDWPGNIKYIPVKFIDKALCLLAKPGESGFEIKYVPTELIDYDVCLHAARCGENINRLPMEFVDQTLCREAVKARSNAIDHIPAEFIDDELYFQFIAGCGYWAFENQLPARYKTTAMLKKAIAFDKRALDSIWGNQINQELFEYAKELYGNDEDWPDIVARHDLDYCKQNEDVNFAEICWSIFWNEEFMLQKIADKSYPLSPWEIPDRLFTQAIADACNEHHLIHLDKIPRHFITQSMCDRFSRKYPNMLDRIPVAFRTEKICRAAVEAKVDNLKLVPLKYRSAELCVSALRENADLADDIPLAVEYEVYTRLLKYLSRQFYRGWLHVQRANAALAATPPDIERAWSDLQTVLNATDPRQFQESHIEEATYLIGYCHYLRGELDSAQAWFQKVSGWVSYDEFGYIDPSEPVDSEEHISDQYMH